MSLDEIKTEADIEGPEDLPLQRFLTYRLSIVGAKLNAQAGRFLKEQAGLTLTQWRIIASIGAGGETSQAELCRFAAFDKGLLSRRLKTLIENGVVLSRTNERDHRVQRLSLSDKGRRIFEETLPKMRARQAYLNASLTEEELSALHSAFSKLEVAAEATSFD